MAKILIIDDRPVNRQFLVTLLGYQQHALREASDGVEGLAIAREFRPELIISDVLMPTMDGCEFVRRLREEPQISKTPVIFSTAHYLSREAQGLAEKCGIRQIIYKPCEPQAVLDIVDGALQGAVKVEPPPPVAEEIEQEHLRLVTNKLAEKTEQLRDAHGKLTALIELSTELSTERDPVELLGRYCSVAREVIGARWTLVGLLARDHQTVQHLGVVGLELDDSPELRSALVDAGVFRTVVNENRAICLSGATSTPEELMLPRGLPRAESLVVAPLAMRGHAYGWICLADKLGFEAFSEQDEKLVTAMAAKMAVAYDNAYLYDESIKYAATLEAEIAERTKVARQLTESEARLAGIIGSAMDSIITIDSEQRIALFNEAAEDLFRCTATEAIGQPLDRFIPPNLRLSHAETIRKFGETGVTTRAMAAARAVTGVRADGEEFPAEASISQIETGGQKLYTVIMRDVTKRKQAEEKLRESESRYRSLFDNMLNGFAFCRMIFDGDKPVDFVYLAVNRAFETNTGLTDVVGKRVSEVIPGITQTDFDLLERYGRVARTGVPERFEIWLEALQNWFSISVYSPLEDHFGVTFDVITERKLADEELKKTNQHLEKALSDLHSKQDELASMTQQLWQASKLATMGELAASIAHELNNPLATVGLRTENLLMQMPDDADRRKPLEIIQQEVDRMATLVNNLLQFSRRSHRQVSTVDLREEVATSVEFVQYHLRNHKIEVVRDFADPLPTIQADRQQLRQLFLNLLTNASDAMPNGGTLTIRAAVASLDGSNAIAIDFADTGEGITPENLEKIGEPFFTTKPEGKGTGLGLAICHRIVEEHKGGIQIESQPGQGTVIHVIFPAAATDQERA